MGTHNGAGARANGANPPNPLEPTHFAGLLLEISTACLFVDLTSFRHPPSLGPSCCRPWLKVSLALRMALTYPWDANAWAEVRQHIPWLLAEQSRIRRAGWLN